MARFIQLKLRAQSKRVMGGHVVVNADQVAAIEPKRDDEERTSYVVMSSGDVYWVAGKRQDVWAVLAGWAAPEVWQQITGTAPNYDPSRET